MLHESSSFANAVKEGFKAGYAAISLEENGIGNKERVVLDKDLRHLMRLRKIVLRR